MPEIPSNSGKATFTAEEYDAAITAERARLENYRASLQQEYESRTINEEDVRYRARRQFVDNIEDIAERIVLIATGKHPDTSANAELKAATFIYERVIQQTDNPDKDGMEALLDKLKKPVPESDEVNAHDD